MKDTKRIIYCIPGLGQDERVFSHLKIHNTELRFLNWHKADPKDDIGSYARKLAAKIDSNQKEVYLLGVSLGGIMAVEIADLIPIKKCILISTVKNKNELPATFSWFGKVPVKTNSIPKFIIEAQIILKPFYGKTDEKGNQLFNEMLKSSDLNFIRWAWNHIPQWNYNKEVNAPFIHFHGTSDHIFPIKNIDQAITLKGATHYAIYDERKKLNQLIELYL